MKKILFIDVNFKYGSTGKIVFDLHNWFLDNNFLSISLYGRGKKINQPNVYKISSIIEVYIHAILTRLFGYVGFGSYFSTQKAINLIKKFKPDVVSLHNLHGYFINIYKVLDFLKKSNIPTYATCHDYFNITGKCGYPKGCGKFITSCEKCPQKKSYPKSLFFDRTNIEYNIKRKLYFNFTNLTFIPVSKWLSNSFKISPLTKTNKINFIHNGIDTNIFNINRDREAIKFKLGFSHKKIIIHVTSNLYGEMKGGKYFLDIANKMKNHENLIFLLIGHSNEIPNMPINIINLGKIYDQNTLAIYYFISDILLLTSLEETFSMVTAESLCCGTPVIGFNAGGPNEVAPVGFGSFHNYGNVNNIIESIERFYRGQSDLKNRNEISNFGIEMYSISKMGQNYKDIFFQNKGDTTVL